jgi:hypothetical protein
MSKTNKSKPTKSKPTKSKMTKTNKPKPTKSKMTKTKKNSKTSKNSNNSNNTNNSTNVTKTKCDKDYTYNGVVNGYIDAIDGLGMAVINKELKLNNKVKQYKKSLYRYNDCMIKLHKRIKDSDKKEDLKVMLGNFKNLIKNVENGGVKL